MIEAVKVVEDKKISVAMAGSCGAHEKCSTKRLEEMNRTICKECMKMAKKKGNVSFLDMDEILNLGQVLWERCGPSRPWQE